MSQLKKGLSLCIIVGSGEENELDRLLKSCTPEGKQKLFDEICITHASKEEDPNIVDVIKKYTENYSFFKWNSNFSDARNFNFRKASYSMIMWLDSDDLIRPDDYDKLLTLKPTIYNKDLILLTYVYHHDEKDNPVVVLPRERIIRNCEEIRWHDPIHEYLPMFNHFKMENHSEIAVQHYRVKPFNPERNLSILAEEYKKSNCSGRTKFYYGKELFDIQKYAEALPVLENYLSKDNDDFVDNKCVASIKLSTYFYVQRNVDACRNYAMKGIRFNPNYAENYVTMGDTYSDENKIDTAIEYYKEAKTKRLVGGMSQLVDYYGFIPSYRLAVMCAKKKEFREAIRYVEEALALKPQHEQLLKLQQDLKNEFDSTSKVKLLDESSLKKITDFLKENNFIVNIEDNNSDFARLKVTRVKNISVAWMIPYVNIDDPATRIRRVNIHELLATKNVKTQILANIITDYNARNPMEIRNAVGDANIAIFSTFNPTDVEVIKHFKSVGIKVIFDLAEAIFDFPGVSDILKMVDLVVCCSTKLQEMCIGRGISKTAVIKDAVEPVDVMGSTYENHEKPKAGFFGCGGNSFLVTDYLRGTIEKAGYEIFVCSEWENATKKWHRDTWAKDMSDCDVILCPQRVEVQAAKSNVKATTAMALGMPVLASRIKSYEEVIKNGENGYICDSMDDWYKALVELKDPAKRKQIGTAAKSSIGQYTQDFISSQWITTFNKILSEEIKEVKVEPTVSDVKSRDLVDIIIPNYQNLDYLKMCLTSIRLNTTHPYNLIISDAGSGEEVWNYLRTLQGITVLGSPTQRKTYSEACNSGIEASNTKYFVILNSDVIVSSGWLTNLVDKMDSVERLAACGVLSNCDRGWLFRAPEDSDPRLSQLPVHPMTLMKSGVNLHPGMKKDEIEPHIEELYKFMEDSNKANKGKFVRQSWVAGYATIYARTAINEVGLFDTQYKNGCEDSDLCLRLAKSYFSMGQAVDSFVFHFGGVSRGAYQDENKEEYDREDTENHIKYRVKWAKQRVWIYTGPAWEPWDKAKVDAGMAGSETWATYLGEAFVRRGYDVRIYNDLDVEDKSLPKLEPVYVDNELIGAVTYRHHTNLLDDLKYDHIDYFISSRTVAPYFNNVHSCKKFVMVHDIWLSNDPNYDLQAWQIFKYAYLSEWHKNFLIHHHKMPPEKMFLTGNGVVQELYKDVDTVTKKKQMVYSSSPDRGLYQLLQMLPSIRKEVPDFQILIAYGFFNWESAAKSRDDKASMALIDKIKKLMEQPGVVYLDRVDKKTLAQHQKESMVWFQPTWFSETFCITAVENGLSKNAILSTDFAGLTTTVGKAGVLIPYDPRLTRDEEYPKEYTDKFISEAVMLLNNDEYRDMMSKRAYEKMVEYSWDNIAEGWIKQFKA